MKVDTKVNLAEWTIFIKCDGCFSLLEAGEEDFICDEPRYGSLWITCVVCDTNIEVDHDLVPRVIETRLVEAARAEAARQAQERAAEHDQHDQEYQGIGIGLDPGLVTSTRPRKPSRRRGRRG